MDRDTKRIREQPFAAPGSVVYLTFEVYFLILIDIVACQLFLTDLVQRYSSVSTSGTVKATAVLIGKVKTASFQTIFYSHP